MRKKSCFDRPLALFLAFTLLMPAPSFALRPQETRESAGAEEIQSRLEEAAGAGGGTATRLGAAAGAEEGRKPLKTLGLVAAALLGVAAVYFGAKGVIGLVEKPAAPPLPVKPAEPPRPDVQRTGAMAALREKLGPDRTIGIHAWDPADLATRPELKGFFRRAARNHFDTVWVSGYRFRSLSITHQQRIVTSASDGGVKVLSFIDGNDDWPEQREFVAGHYRDLAKKLSQLDLGNLQIGFAADIEPYTRPGWRGDLKPDMDLIERTILPPIRDFGKRTGRLREPVVLFQPWWYENGRRTDSGAVLSGLREISGTAVAGMTYRADPAGIRSVSEPLRKRARQGGSSFFIGVETIPAKEAGTPSYHGNISQIPADLGAVFGSLPADDKARLAGVYIHARDPRSADAILQEMEQEAKPAPPPAEPPQENPQDAKVKSAKLQGNVLTLALEGVPDGAIATYWQEDRRGDPGAFYRQPGPSDAWTVRDGAVTITNPHTDRRKTFDAGRRYIVLFRNRQGLNAFLQELNPDDPSFFNVATIRRLMGNPLLVRDAGLLVIEVVTPERAIILRGGLEEGARLVDLGAFMARARGLPEGFQAPAGQSHVVLLSEEAFKALSDRPEARSVYTYSHASVAEGLMSVLPDAWELAGMPKILPEGNPARANQMLEEASGRIREGKTVLVALDYEKQAGLILPETVILLLHRDPKVLDRLDRALLNAILSSAASLAGDQKQFARLILDLSAGSILRVEIDGKPTYAVLATAA